MSRRLAKKMLKAERGGGVMRHASDRREQARVKLSPTPANRAYFEARHD